MPNALAQSQFAARVAEAAEALPPDVWLIAADGSRHGTHRLVLSARSPFFFKMLSSGMREQITGEVNLPDVEPECLAAVLAWMYSREAVVDISSSSMTLSLLELAKRWEITELCEQLSSCEACALAESNVVAVWETAQRLCLDKLECRCRDFVMSQLADTLQEGASSLPPSFRDLKPAQFRLLLESNDLPIANEEEAFDVALAYLREREDSLEALEADGILLAVRWRLIPGPVIAERAMRHPALLGEGGRVRSTLLPALADGMQFQFLGGKAWSLLQASPSSSLRTHHCIGVRSYASLATGMTVRVLSDVEQLRHLCKRCAPGARLKVEWVAEMKQLAGATCRVKELRDEIAGVQIEDPLEHVDRYLPFDALLLA